MPKKDIDYSKTIIYKLVHKDDINNENIYTGHTTDFTHRKHSHKYGCNTPNKKEYNQKKYVFIRDHGGFEDWCMLEIEKYPCNDANEARARENYWMNYYKATLNTQVPNRTQVEYTEINKEKRLEYHKKWYIDNKENVNDKRKEKIICECGVELRKCDIERHKKSKKHLKFLEILAENTSYP